MVGKGINKDRGLRIQKLQKVSLLVLCVVVIGVLILLAILTKLGKVQLVYYRDKDIGSLLEFTEMFTAKSKYVTVESDGGYQHLLHNTNGDSVMIYDNSNMVVTLSTFKSYFVDENGTYVSTNATPLQVADAFVGYANVDKTSYTMERLKDSYLGGLYVTKVTARSLIEYRNILAFLSDEYSSMVVTDILESEVTPETVSSFIAEFTIATDFIEKYYIQLDYVLDGSRYTVWAVDGYLLTEDWEVPESLYTDKNIVADMELLIDTIEPILSKTLGNQSSEM